MRLPGALLLMVRNVADDALHLAASGCAGDGCTQANVNHKVLPEGRDALAGDPRCKWGSGRC